MRVKDVSNNLDCFKATWRYFGDKGVYLMLINILPSLLLPFAVSPSVTMYYLFDMENLNVTSVASLIKYMWDMPFSFWYIGVIGAVLLMLTVAITFGVIDRHMRVGEFTVSPSRVKDRLNYNLITSVKFVIVAFISLEFFNLVATLLYYLWATVFSGAVKIAFSVLTLAGMEICMVYTMSWFILWPPFMLHTGMRSSQAIKSAWGSMGGRLNKTAFSLLCVVIPFQLVMAITAFFETGAICRTILDALAYIVIIPYFFTLMYNMFYDVTGTERMDLQVKKKNIWAKK